MKKNTSLILVAVVALAAGYALGAYLGTGDSNKTKGDINAVNTYKQILTAPEDMAFNEEMADDAEVIAQTISTLQIAKERMCNFGTMVALMKTIATDEAELAQFAETFSQDESNRQTALTQVDNALQAAQALKNGEKTDLQKAMKDAKAVFEYLAHQSAIGKTYTEAVDKFLKGKDVKAYISIASMRDLIVSHCAVNASLTQDDRAIDYWYNIDGLVQSEDMTFSIPQ